MSAPFVSLHNHTEYSFLDGAIKVKDLVRQAKKFDMPAVAITDHGGLFGAVEFYETCKKEGVKPIIGFEAYVAPGSRLDKTQITDKEKSDRYYCHLILLAENNTGWKNLMKLSSIGYMEGFYYKPRVDMEVLRRHSEGIIATSACVAGAIPQAILRGDMAGARRLTEEHIEIFGKDNFFFELQDHGIEEEVIAMKGMIALGREMGIPFIVANDAHYLRREDAPSHEILLCIGTRDTLDNPKHYKFSSNEIYFKSPEEMSKLFPEIPEAMTNTVTIAERCNVNIKVDATLPSVDVPAEFGSAGDYLSHLARTGLRERYAEVTPELTERLEYELKVINDMKFPGYFLIVRDFVQKARELDILVGCRGSAAGCLVFYSIGVTDIDPIKFDLIFERFLNPERISMPDADIDLADRDRHKIIDYIVNRYGRDSVCQIITFGSMAAKNVVRDVARVKGVSPEEAVELTKKIPKDPKITLKKALGIPDKVKVVKDGMEAEEDYNTPALSEMIAGNSLERYVRTKNELTDAVLGNSLYRDIFYHASVLEGLKRQPGMHPAGMIIAPSKVEDWVPLFKQSNAEEIMTQFDLNYVEKIGLVKMDLLGLKTLSLIQEAIRLIKKYHNVDINPWALPDDDPGTFELFGDGDTVGVFQFESPPMREYLRKLRPTSIEDIISMVALYRPGPMDNIDMFINRKHGREKIEYQHPMLAGILDVTYGVIIYQEQVMRIAQVMGKFTLGSADVLRKAMGKKNVAEMKKMGEQFVKGAMEQGIEEKTAREVYDHMAKFAGYGFNKSHAGVYAHLSYQTAYLKAHYPLEYMTSILTAYLGSPDDFLAMRNEAERMGIHVVPPDVNTSDKAFSIDNGSIRIGLEAVKNVGKAGELILKARDEKGRFTSIFDLCASTDNRIVNKKALESLICAGAFDGYDGTRAQHMAAVESALEYGKKVQEDRASGQVNLFEDLLSSGDAAMISAAEPSLPQVTPWTMREKLQREKEILGFYASGQPIDQFRDEIAAFTDAGVTGESIRAMPNNSTATVGGVITDFRPLKTKKDNRDMASMKIETPDATLNLIVFTEAYARYRDMLANDAMLLVYGRVMNKDEAKISVESCMHLYQVREALTKGVHIRVSPDSVDEGRMRAVYDCCAGHPGECYLVIHVGGSKLRSKTITVSPGHELIKALRDIAGKENVWISRAID
ncbi:MAG: DNA polymerase III subunit alpha [Chitinispirillia bacterium]|nr:DNA polymerase III subunit alpha [Chitinispirillia bacterium]MCL2241597.1 DNA polymerase III subunit alpha [Chitinispirillia bacterium]